MNGQTTKGKSLAAVVTFHCVWLIALFMFLYGWMEAALFKESVLFAFLKHAYHVIILGAGMLILLNIVIHRQVRRPISQINELLIRTGAGQLDVPVIETGIRELNQIEGGIRAMREMILLRDPGHRIEKAQKALEEIRKVARHVHASAPAESEALLEAAARLRDSLGVLLTPQG